jgi:hypothetical protein
LHKWAEKDQGKKGEKGEEKLAGQGCQIISDTVNQK